jgi:hypothetical protein
MQDAAIRRRTFRIVSRPHRVTGLIASYSNDLPGLLVVAHTEEEMTRKLPGAIRELLEALGCINIELTFRRGEGPADFGTRDFIVDVVEVA